MTAKPTPAPTPAPVVVPPETLAARLSLACAMIQSRKTTLADGLCQNYARYAANMARDLGFP